MSLNRSIIANLVAVFVLFILSSQAQIATYTDANGKRVFINGDSPKARSGSTIVPSASRQQVASPNPASAISSPSQTISTAAPDPRLEKIVQDAAARHQVDPALVKAVINTESGWNSTAVSRKGAMGLMQLIPGTAERFGVGNPYDPVQNIEGGTTYLRSLLDRYNGDLSKSLAAYNAGEGAVDRSGGVPWYPETRRYVQKVTDAYFRPDSGYNLKLLSQPPPKASPVHTEVDAKGRVIFTNE
jgi:soluble lytic murein transglycosylase-like protein